MLFFNDPLTRVKRERSKRQRQAVFNLGVGLVLGSSVMFLVMELVNGVTV